MSRFRESFNISDGNKYLDLPVNIGIDRGLRKSFEIVDKFINAFLSSVKFGNIVFWKLCGLIHFVDFPELLPSVVLVKEHIELE